MDETSRETVTVWQFLRRHFVWIVVGAILVLATYGMLIVWMPYQREQRIASEIQASGATVDFRYSGPDWVSESVRHHLPFLDRIRGIGRLDQAAAPALFSELGSLTSLDVLYLQSTQVTDDGLEHLKGLTNLYALDLLDTQITDAGMEHLKRLTRLNDLRLTGTRVTDAGLEYLKGLASLERLDLSETKITDVGVEHLKGLTRLCELRLGGTQITDAGLEHLKGLTILELLELEGCIQVTPEGREMLRKSLPNCKIEPNP